MLTNELNPYGSKLKLSLLSTFDLPNVIKDSIHYISCRGFFTHRVPDKHIAYCIVEVILTVLGQRLSNSNRQVKDLSAKTLLSCFCHL